ncbi:hypothetical protein [Moorena sp. SIO4G3]|uniref:hypothetical protein n=1 Tax=Moorena sp. SIO4G3 TaxID=2607821 RepID=UPI00142BA203|nr:hypothetical protein [Moorena sp. SIO4G3]NEO78309.1 hypothetical protein [Moorena sp. SIO4G3]
MDSISAAIFFYFTPYSLLPALYSVSRTHEVHRIVSLLANPCSLLPAPCSLFPVPFAI